MRPASAQQLLLHDRHVLDRQLDAEVAARDHHAVGGADDLLGRARPPAASRSSRSAAGACALRTSVTSSGSRTNDSATRSTPIDSPKRSSSRSSCGTDGSRASTPGTLSPWREATRAADLDDRCRPRRSRTALTRRRTRAVGEVDDVVGLDRARQARPARARSRSSSPGSSRAAARASAGRPGCSSIEVLAQRADAQLRPGQVLQDRDLAPGAARPPSRTRCGVLGVLLARAVGEVQPRDVDARPRPCARASRRSRQAGPMVATILVRRTAWTVARRRAESMGRRHLTHPGGWLYR